INAGTNSSVFTPAGLNSGDIVNVVMTSSLTCVSGSPAASNNIPVIINPLQTPSVTVSVSPGTIICQGDTVTFTANAISGGVTPCYQWKVNGLDVGTNSSSFTTHTLNNGDVVTVVLTSSEACVTSSTATSSAVTMVVNGAPPQPG